MGCGDACPVPRQRYEPGCWPGGQDIAAVWPIRDCGFNYLRVARAVNSEHPSPFCLRSASGDNRIGDEPREEANEEPVGDKVGALGAAGDAEQLGDDVNDGSGGQG